MSRSIVGHTVLGAGTARDKRTISSQYTGGRHRVTTADCIETEGGLSEGQHPGGDKAVQDDAEQVQEDPLVLQLPVLQVTRCNEGVSMIRTLSEATRPSPSQCTATIRGPGVSRRTPGLMVMRGRMPGSQGQPLIGPSIGEKRCPV